jgi:FixJ family two-component response regulator
MPRRVTPLIAIIDDDVSALQAAVSLVRSLGFETASFSSAADFLGSADREAAICLVLDMRMPGMSGIELHKHLVAAGTPIPAIIVTAHHQDGNSDRALSAGAAAYLTKPLQPDQLLAAIRAAIAGSAGGAAA